MPSRIEKAKRTQCESKNELEQLIDNSSGKIMSNHGVLVQSVASVNFSTSDIKQWYEDECKLPHPHSKFVAIPSYFYHLHYIDMEDEETSWELEYFTLLKMYYRTR